mmetsp:Transcript_26223/g.74577  ORF Transcript_26223/g.74577 Transcript_26223/m.74577 type:complete len:413 (-) Transcript_26223:230-1468(-)
MANACAAAMRRQKGRLRAHVAKLRSCLPFWRNWNTAVATSTLSGFLSGCQFRSNNRHSLARCSFGSMDCNLVKFFSASNLASSISFDSLTSPSPAPPEASPPALLFRLRLRLRPPLLLDEIVSLLLDFERLLERCLGFLCFLPFLLFFFFFLLPELLELSEDAPADELLLLLLLLLFTLLLLLFAVSEAASCWLPPLKHSRMAREPAWGDQERLFSCIWPPAHPPGARSPCGPGMTKPLPGTKQPPFPIIGCPPTKPLPAMKGAPLQHGPGHMTPPLPQHGPYGAHGPQGPHGPHPPQGPQQPPPGPQHAPQPPHGPPQPPHGPPQPPYPPPDVAIVVAAVAAAAWTKAGGPPTGCKPRAWGLPSGARNSSKYMLVPARSEVLSSVATLSRANQMSCGTSGWMMKPKPLTEL